MRATGWRAAVVFAAAALGAREAALAGETGEPQEEPAHKEREPICTVDIVNEDGLPSKGLLLLAFEGGVYRVRAEDGGEIELHEKELRSVKFLPLGAREARRKPPRTAVARHGERPPKVARERPPRGRWKDERLQRRLREYKESGKLAEAISLLEERFRDAKSAEEARGLIHRIRLAKGVNRERITQEYMRKLLKSIKDPKVREELKKRRGPRPFFRPGRRRGRDEPGKM